MLILPVRMISIWSNPLNSTLSVVIAQEGSSSSGTMIQFYFNSKAIVARTQSLRLSAWLLIDWLVLFCAGDGSSGKTHGDSRYDICAGTSILLQFYFQFSFCLCFACLVLVRWLVGWFVSRMVSGLTALHDELVPSSFTWMPGNKEINSISILLQCYARHPAWSIFSDA